MVLDIIQIKQMQNAITTTTLWMCANHNIVIDSINLNVTSVSVASDPEFNEDRFRNVMNRYVQSSPKTKEHVFTTELQPLISILPK